MPLSMQIEQVLIKDGSVEMQGVLWLPEDHIGVIVFGNCSEAKRLNPPNDYVASVLHNARLGTLWLDLLTPQECRQRELHDDVPLLAHRLGAACTWLRQEQQTRGVPIGLFGTGSGAAAALQLAADCGKDIVAVVSRGGRTELADVDNLGRISAPTLLIVGGLDDGAVECNRTAYATLRCKKKFEIIPGATHSFDEPGSLEVVARLSRGWFVHHSSSHSALRTG
jgi:putative phosphoribosyl transferase